MTQHSPGAPRNRLAAETSPYLLQHAANPVDWHPWGPAALELARRLDKPILLSIGYSACHWCHVMAHESFEDEATAALMNELFVCVKVDREERPDLDKVYQLSHQVLTQRGGGWPLTMFLSPADLTPFFGGTYFPPEARWGMPSFRDLLQRVAGYYRERRDEIGRQNAALREVFDDLMPPPAAAEIALSRAPIDAARQDLEASFDAQFGGFGGAPKFPHPGSIDRLLRDWHATATASEPDLQALYMATLTLKRMTEGGLYDQLGGGFCRYSVDAYWMIPHFEKMLYDNGPLLALAAQAAIATGEGLFRRAAIETGEWALREMQSPEGGFYSALDADSEGHEGKFYAWDRAEVEALLTRGEYRAFARRYGLDREANFEGKWHLHCFVAIDEIAAELGLEPGAATEVIDAARAKLLSVRNRRVWPGRDDKVLTAWNGLMIRGLAVAGRALERADFVAAAGRAADFIRAQCWRDGQLLAAYKDGQARFPAYLDDYAFLLDGLLELLQARWRSEDLAFAQALADTLLQRFEDRERGGFWFTAEGAETPLYRPKGFADEAMPAGNGVAAAALARLGWLAGETRYLDAAERTLRGGWASMTRAPQAHTTMLAALEEFLAPGDVIILRGEASTVGQWQSALAPLYAPRRSVYAIPASAADLPPALASKLPRGPAVAYVCSGPQCSPPIEELTRLTRWLRDGVLTGTP